MVGHLQSTASKHRAWQAAHWTGAEPDITLPEPATSHKRQHIKHAPGPTCMVAAKCGGARRVLEAVAAPQPNPNVIPCSSSIGSTAQGVPASGSRPYSASRTAVAARARLSRASGDTRRRTAPCSVKAGTSVVIDTCRWEGRRQQQQRHSIAEEGAGVRHRHTECVTTLGSVLQHHSPLPFNTPQQVRCSRTPTQCWWLLTAMAKPMRVSGAPNCLSHRNS